MNNKGLVFSISLVLVTLGALVAVIFLSDQIERDISGLELLGERAAAVSRTTLEGEKILFFIDSAAQQSVFSTISTLTLQGGFSGASCAVKQGNVWFWNKKDNPSAMCTPDISSNFNKEFGKELDDRLKVFKGRMIENNYDFHISGSTLNGYSSIPLEFVIFEKAAPVNVRTSLWYLGIASILSSALNPGMILTIPAAFMAHWTFTRPLGTFASGAYTIQPDFSVNFPYDIALYQKLSAFATSALNCRSNETAITLSCLDKLKSAQGLASMVIVPSKDEYIFSYELGPKNPLTSKPVLAIFGLFLPPP